MKWSAGLVACLPAKPSMQMYMLATYGSYEMGVLGFLTLVWLHIDLNKRWEEGGGGQKSYYSCILG